MRLVPARDGPDGSVRARPSGHPCQIQSLVMLLEQDPGCDAVAHYGAEGDVFPVSRWRHVVSSR